MNAPVTPPDWFPVAEEIIPRVLERLASKADSLNLPMQVRFAPRQAFCFLANSMLLANRANREGMHANALAITRQCLEAISVLELGLVQSGQATNLLERWEADKVSPGEIRKWLEANIWESYGTGLWSEKWAEFMGKLCKASQPYAHYSPKLAQWQSRIVKVEDESEDGNLTLIVELGAKSYDPQKATRITLFHGLIHFALARIWVAHSRTGDLEFESLVERLRIALGKSVYLDGDHTDWDEQFWAMLWFRDGNNCPE
jgi:hypothetical protein